MGVEWLSFGFSEIENVKLKKKEDIRSDGIVPNSSTECLDYLSRGVNTASSLELSVSSGSQAQYPQDGLE